MAHSSREYQKDYMWVYRLHNQLKAESLQKVDIEYQKFKNDELQSLRQEAIIQGLNFLLEQIPFLTDEQRKTILKERDRLLLKIDEIVQEQAKNLDDKIAKARIQHVVQYDIIFEKTLSEYKARIANDPAFRSEVAHHVKEQINKIEIQIPFTNHGVV